MTKVEEIVKQAEALPETDLAALIDHLWDLQIAQDVKAGRLDHLAEEALAEHKAGKTRPL
jgi:hypothetical protein